MWRYLQSSVSLILQTFPHNALPSRFSFVSSKWLGPPRTWRFSRRSPSTSLSMYSSPNLPSFQINAVNQSQFILDARDTLNHYNQQYNTQITSLPLSQHPDHKPPALSALRRHFQSGKLARFRLLVDSIIRFDPQAGSRQGNRVFLHRSEAFRGRIPRTAAAKHPVGLLPSISTQLGLHSIHRPHRPRLLDSNSIHSDAQHRQRRSSPLSDCR